MMSASSPVQQPKSKDGSSQKKPEASHQPLVPLWFWLFLLLASSLWNGYVLFVPKPPLTASIPYTEFLDQVRRGAVATVLITGQRLDGTFAQPTVWPPRPAGAPSTEGAESTSTYTHFSTVLPQTNDPALLPLLDQQHVTVSFSDTGAGSWLISLLINGLPILLFVGLLLLLGHQARRGQQSLFGFGTSHARLYNTERPAVSFADVAGEEEAKGELREIVSFLKDPERYRALGARLPRGVLLVGPPGTGKTLLARAVAGEAGVPFFTISASEFVELFVGVGASRVRDLFATAKKSAPSIVFVDELDAVGRQRGAGIGGGNDEREQTLNQLLVEMDGFDEQISVIVLAATNRPDVLDPALLRPGRFDRHVGLGLPDRAGREAILMIHTRHLPLEPDVALITLAQRTAGFSGADLANLCNEAALAAARRNATKVSAKDFEDAMEKIIFGTRQASLLGDEERRLVAYHESGHALVARLTPGADPVSKVTIIPHSMALGATEQVPQEDRHTYPRAYLLGRLTVMLGGRAAEELIFDEPTTGAQNDLEQATALARRMVGLWGMTPEVGPVSYGLGATHAFLGRELALPREHAEATAGEIDRAVRRVIEESYECARSTLDRERPLLHAIAEELLLQETLDGRQIDALLEAQGLGIPPKGDHELPTCAAADGRPVVAAA